MKACFQGNRDKTSGWLLAQSAIWDFWNLVSLKNKCSLGLKLFIGQTSNQDPAVFSAAPPFGRLTQLPNTLETFGREFRRINEVLFPNCPHCLASSKGTKSCHPVPLLSSPGTSSDSLGLIFLHPSLFSIPVSTPASSSTWPVPQPLTNSPAQTSRPTREMRWVPRSPSVCERGPPECQRFRSPEEGGVLRKSRNASGGGGVTVLDNE